MRKKNRLMLAAAIGMVAIVVATSAVRCSVAQVEQEQEAAGSGIFIGENDKELLVVTNYHVVADSTKLSVKFIDDEVVEAQIKGTSPSMDLAVIAVKLEDINRAVLPLRLWAIPIH